MNNKIIVGYSLIKGSDDLHLEDFTMLEIQKGWQPFGAPFFDEEDGFLVQALVKYEDEEQPTVDNFENSYLNLLKDIEKVKQSLEKEVCTIQKKIMEIDRVTNLTLSLGDKMSLLGKTHEMIERVIENNTRKKCN